MSSALDLVAELVLRESGIRVQSTQRTALLSAIVRALPNGNPATFLRLAGNPLEGRQAIERLIDEVTIKETSFFRDRQQLDAIDWRRLLDRAQARGSSDIRVWCVPCATGEEAYTLALLACEAFSTSAPPVRILATDISSAALAAARAGTYRERSLRTVAPDLRRRYFEPDGDAHVVGHELRKIVRLAKHNLVTGTMPPSGETTFDLIVCRNVLIYFDGATADHVVRKLEGALRPEGVLILGSADVLCGTARSLGRASSNAASSQRIRPAQASLRRPLGLPEAAEVLGPADQDDLETRFLHAMSELEAGDAPAAAELLRHVLYLDPTFGLAAFALGRAHEAMGDPRAARRAYQHALRTIDMEDDRHDHLLEQIDLADVATACRARLATL